MQAYLDAVQGWKQAVAVRIDALISRAVSEVRKAVKYNSPMYGVEEGLWFMSMHCYDRYLKVAFFMGAHLDPQPPGKSKQANVRYLDLREGDVLDEGLFIEWVRQASQLPGEKI